MFYCVRSFNSEKQDMKSKAIHSILFTVEEAAALVEMRAQTLRNWCKWGVIEPAVRGGAGRGKGHSFSLWQTMALAWAWSLVHSLMQYKCIFLRDSTRDFITRMSEGFEELPQEELNDWLTAPRDSWEQESRDARRSKRNLLRPPMELSDMALSIFSVEAFDAAYARTKRVYATYEAKCKATEDLMAARERLRLAEQNMTRARIQRER
jgi:hypothetical protein